MGTTPKLKTPLAEVETLENGIVFINFTETILEDISLMRKHVQMIEAHFGTGLYAISDLSRTKKVSAEMRKFCATAEVLSAMVVTALMVSGGVSRIAGNLFLTFNKPVIPTKLFNSFEKAEEWILAERAKRVNA